MNPKAALYIDKLGMKKHPEGGYYSESYRANEYHDETNLPSRYKGNRDFYTVIYFLLDGNDFSAFHRMKSDEILHFYDGSAMTVNIIAKDGTYTEVVTGSNLDNGEQFHVLIPKDCWFAFSVNDKSSFSLIGTTVAPGFDFQDFEMGDREILISRYPHLKKVITDFTRL